MVAELNLPFPVHFTPLIPKMLMFTLAISYLTTSSLPWFMDLTFQVSMQYCFLQLWALLSPPDTSTTGYCFCFGSIPSFFLEVFLHWSPVVYWAPTDLGNSSLTQLLHSFWSYFSALLQGHIGHLPTWRIHHSVSYLFAFSCYSWSSQGKNTGVVCHSLLQWTTLCQNSPPWPIHLGWPYTTWLIVSLSYTNLWSMWSF